MQEVYEFLKNCGTYYIATIEEGKPKVRPFGTIDLYDNALYIQTGKRKAVSKQIHDCPYIEICAFAKGVWVRVAAEAYADERLSAEEHMLAAYPELSGMYKAGDGNNEVFRLKNVTATFYSFGGEPREIKF